MEWSPLLLGAGSVNAGKRAEAVERRGKDGGKARELERGGQGKKPKISKREAVIHPCMSSVVTYLSGFILIQGRFQCKGGRRGGLALPIGDETPSTSPELV